MPVTPSEGRLEVDALAVWQTGVDAVRPGPLVAAAWTNLPSDVKADITAASRVLVVGAGKAGAGMAAALEEQVRPSVNRLTGLVNVPAGSERPLKRIRLHPARPAGWNHPTAAGVAGAEEMLALLGSAGPADVAVCLLSGGGSALLPAPAAGVSLEDKQSVTKLLHASGATIREMNAVRKHLSRVKGGRLAEAFRGKRMISLIISDVVGDPLDVIASGPTAPDPTTFANAVAVLEKYNLTARVPTAVLDHLRAGVRGEIAEAPKALPPTVSNVIIGSNATALAAAKLAAEARGYRVLDLGPFVEGETKEVAVALAGVVRSIRERGQPVFPPACVLVGGETTVTLGPQPGRGGRSQEFVLALADKLGGEGMKGVCVLSGGTDGEDGPTDAAGAVATAETLARAAAAGLDPADHLRRHDAYPIFAAANGLIRTGLTGTNVTDVRVILVR
jgi:hydroxypyruvate reductase/glycerate 2-kinase